MPGGWDQKMRTKNVRRDTLALENLATRFSQGQLAIPKAANQAQTTEYHCRPTSLPTSRPDALLLNASSGPKLLPSLLQHLPAPTSSR